jgi:hypothetical protein
MGRKDKLIQRFKSQPKDFTFPEAETMMAYLGYEIRNKGATSGSRVRFYNPTTGVSFDMHRPHPGSILKEAVVKSLLRHLQEYDLI